MKKEKTNRRQQFISGIQAGIPVMIGYLPVAIAYAFMARQAGLSVFDTILMSLTVFAGAAQMMASGMYAQGAGIAAIVITTFILNLRHLIMSTCVMNRVKEKKPGLKLLCAFGVTDEAFAVFTTEPEAKATIWNLVGLVLSTWFAWVGGSAIGAVISNMLPEIITASMAVSLYAMFIGLLLPNLNGNRRLTLLVILTAFCNLILTRVMAGSWALIVSTLVCAFVGVFFCPDEEVSHE